MPRLVSMTIEIVEGLLQLHAVRVWHLDLKPVNMLLEQHRNGFFGNFES